MNNEQLNKILMKADDDLQALKDRCHELYEENERLKERVAYLERSNNRREDTIIGLRFEVAEQEDYKTRCEKAIEYINCNKQKTICAYGDNEDDDFEICLWEEDIDKLLNLLQNGSETSE